VSAAAKMLAEWHDFLGDQPGRGNALLRITLHEEEHEELLDELSSKRLGIDVREPKRDEEVDRAKLARELADVVYVAFGTAHAFAIDLDVALAEIHRAAMSKLHPRCTDCHGVGSEDADLEACVPAWICATCHGTGNGPPVMRADGKILKPPSFVPPDMSGAVAR
jgi:NTP pyrophosphatase (non-canonical NTP hydrolase)